jgi:hypothetical protein
MKNTKSAVLAAAVVLGAALPITNAMAAKFYAVTVTTNFGTQFSDCWTFKGGFKGGTAIVDDLGTLIYTPAPFAEAKDYYTAVASASLYNNYGGSIAFSGLYMGMPGAITWNAVGADYAHDAYYLTATQVSTCETSNVKSSTPYKPAQ